MTDSIVPFLSLMLMILLATSCKHEPGIQPEDPFEGNGGNGNGNGNGTGEEEDPCDPTIVYFEQQVLPILTSNCAVPGCHNVGTDDNDDIQITSYQTLMGSDDIVQDGDLWEVINENDPDDRMPPPPQNPLTDAQIAIIGQWIQQGAQNTSCVSGGCDTLNVTYSGTIVPIIQQHCQGCHSGGTPQGGLNFTVHSVLQTVAMDGRLAGSIQHLPGAIPMPPSGPQLSDCKIEQFLLWIDAGAPNN